MEYTINYLADQIDLIVSGGRPSGQNIDIREIRLLVQELLGKAALDEYYLNYKIQNQDTVNGEWLVTFPLLVGRIGGTNEPFEFAAIIPQPAISLPKNKGYHMVTSGNQQLQTLAYVDYGQFQRLNRGSLSQFINKVFYTIKSGLIVLYSPNEDVPLPQRINVTMAIPSDFNVNEARAVIVIAEALKLLQPRITIKPDMVPDKNPTV